MRSALHDVLPLRLRRSLSKFGHDLAVARRKRHLTVAMMAERTGLARGTYLRTATSAHDRICTGTGRVLSAPSLHWTTWAAGAGPLNWCRVRDFHPQPLRSERSASGSWANAA